ncbi:MAG TPA: cyclic pyranopterin monophosphate synthase MoaC [bacterium]|nr:cyclic pyranopterin monophosphate synthase MoaC [bacterium]
MKTKKKLSHVDRRGKAAMVDVSGKSNTERRATAMARVTMSAAAFDAIQNNTIKKGDVLTVAQLAGIMAAKKTSDLIPLCHPLNLSRVDVACFPEPDSLSIRIEATCKLLGKTGVEMEALTAVTIAALTVYDMAKAMDKKMVIRDICLLEKSGGKSGIFRNNKMKP